MRTKHIMKKNEKYILHKTNINDQKLQCKKYGT